MTNRTVYMYVKINLCVNFVHHHQRLSFELLLFENNKVWRILAMDKKLTKLNWKFACVNSIYNLHKMLSRSLLFFSKKYFLFSAMWIEG